MIMTKEFKGDTRNPNVDNQLNEFFNTMTENDQILDIMYSTALMPVKREGTLQYIIVSTALLLYEKADEEEN